MKTFLKKLAVIPHDKLLHAYLGVIIYVIIITLATPLFALISVIVIAFAKEVYDAISKNRYSEVVDFLATIHLPLFLYLLDTWGLL